MKLFLVANNHKSDVANVEEIYAGHPLIQLRKDDADTLINLPTGKLYYVKNGNLKVIEHTGGCLHFISGNAHAYCGELFTHRPAPKSQDTEYNEFYNKRLELMNKKNWIEKEPIYATHEPHKHD